MTDLQKEKNMKKYILFMIYLATIPAANWFINNVGTVNFPGGPHTIPVGFGYQAPSGVVLIGFALFARDLLQEQAGRKVVVLAILLGVPLSFIVNPAVAIASTVAFTISETTDFVIYDKIRAASKIAGIIISGTIGGIVDSILFLYIAFGSIQYWEGQVIGKMFMSLICAVVWRVSRDLSQRMSTI